MRCQGSSRGRRLAALVVAGALISITGCAAGAADRSPDPTMTPTAAQSATPPPPSVAVPADGVSLRALGFENGPPTFSIPQSAIFVTAVDQPNVVTVVLRSPSPDVVASYLRTNLLAAGFRITASAPTTDTFTFGGENWQGSFTATSGQSAIVLRPA